MASIDSVLADLATDNSAGTKRGFAAFTPKQPFREAFTAAVISFPISQIRNLRHSVLISLLFLKPRANKKAVLGPGFSQDLKLMSRLLRTRWLLVSQIFTLFSSLVKV